MGSIFSYFFSSSSSWKSPEELSIDLTCESDIREDDTNPVYALHIGNWRCQVEKSSTLHYVAIRSKIKKTFPPHCGLMVKNTFHLTSDDVKYEFKYLLAHALKRGSDGTKIVLVFCSDKEIVFQKLRGVHGAYEDSIESTSAGIEASTPCSDLVSLVGEELQKPFDQDWNKHLRGAAKPGKNVTNCALLAARIFSELTPPDNKYEAVDNLHAAFASLGLDELATSYLDDFDD